MVQASGIFRRPVHFFRLSPERLTGFPVHTQLFGFFQIILAFSKKISYNDIVRDYVYL